ncbi:MAG TPA: FecR domain-containing protein [Stellaceae bacterium]|nr:FecR domain-containing protein [Stellaceae bacterium]
MGCLKPLLRRISVGLVAAAWVAAWPEGPGALAQQVGVNTAVNPEATGTPPGAAARKLLIGQEVIHNERIATGPGGQSQILFLDESAMTIGPNSDVTIDDFVYDPRTATGLLEMSVARGVFRFVGGALSKLDNGVMLNTPIARLGIRGGVFLATVTATGETRVVFLYGKGLSVVANGHTEIITRPGFGVTVGARNQAPTAPARVPASQIGLMLAQFNGRSGATGGSAHPPTDMAIVKSGIPARVSGNPAASEAAAVRNTLLPIPPPSIDFGTIEQNLTVATVAAQGSPQSRQVQLGATRGNVAGAVLQLVDPTLGFVNQAFPGTVPFAGGVVAGGVFGFRVPATGNIIEVPVGCSQAYAACTPLSGPGVPAGFGTFTTPNYAAVSYLSPDSSFFFAEFYPFAATDPTRFIFGGRPLDPSFFAPPATTQITAFAVQPEAATQSPVPFTTLEYGGALVGNPVISPFYVVAPAGSSFGAFNLAGNPGAAAPRFLQASLGIEGQGAAQNSLLVIATGAFATTNGGSVFGGGQMRGSLLTTGAAGPTQLSSSVLTLPDGTGNTLFGSNAIQGFVLGQDNPAQVLATATPYSQPAVGYAFTDPTIAATLPPGVGASRTTRLLGGAGFGAAAGLFYPSTGSPYIAVGGAALATDAVGNRVAAAFALGDPYTAAASGVAPGALVLRFGGLTPFDTARSAFIDDNTFAALDSVANPSTLNGNPLPVAAPGQPGTRIALVSSGAVPVGLAGVAPGGTGVPVTPCACQYLQWGYWTGEIDQVGANGALTRSDQAPINLWMAGVPAVARPTSGIASYSGAAVGAVYNGGASYLAAGNYAGTYNFASNTGTAAISNFDGRNLSAAVSLTGSNGVYHGTLSQAGSAAYSGDIYGNFFGPGAVETGGYFAFHNTAAGVAPYLAAGIFAGKQ